MLRKRVQKSSERSPQLQESAIAPVVAQPHSPSPHIQQDTENQEVQQHKHEATILEIQAKYGTITPQAQERLTFLQAKMADYTQRKLAVGNRVYQQMFNSSAEPKRNTAPPVQAKLTIGQPGDKYEQEADRVAAEVVKQLQAPAPQHSAQTQPVQRQALPEQELQTKPTLQLSGGGGMGVKQTADMGVIQRAPVSDYLPGKLKDKYKLSRKPPFLKKRGELETEESEPAQPGDTQQVEPAQPGETQLADNELILVITSTPEEADHLVEVCRRSITAILDNWEFRSQQPDVEVKQIWVDSLSSVTPAVILKWEPAWGTKPITTITTDLSSSLNPIRARLAVTAVQQLDGWDRLDDTERNILKSLLGGETNRLSHGIRIEMMLGGLEALMAMTAPEQEMALRVWIIHKEFKPYLVDEPLTTEPQKYDLKSRGEVKNFKFQGKIAEAEQWMALFKESDGEHRISIYAPKALDSGHHTHTVQQIADAVSCIPKASRLNILSIHLNPILNPDDAFWAAKYNKPDFHSLMSANADGIVRVFPQKVTKPLMDKDELENTLTHETAHIWTRRDWGKDTSQGKWLEWKKCMDADKVSVSGYAMSSIEEDVAETFTAYSSTKGTSTFEEYRQIVPHRFAMLERE